MLPYVIANLIAEYIASYQIRSWVLERAPRLRGKCRESGVMRCRRAYMRECIAGDILDEHYYNSDMDADISDDEYCNFITFSYPYMITVDGKQVPCNEYGQCFCCSFSDPWAISNIYLCANPRAEEYMRGRWIYWEGLGVNSADWAIDALEMIKSEHWPVKAMCQNTNPRIIPMLKTLPIGELYLSEITKNPIMIPWLRENPELISCIDDLLKNPEAKDLIIDTFGSSHFGNANIWSNPAPWAIEEIKKHTFLGQNTLGFKIAQNPNDWVVNHVTSIVESKYWTDQEREAIYRNPNPRALNFVRDHPEIFPLSPMIWSNPEIFYLAPDPNIVSALQSF